MLTSLSDLCSLAIAVAIPFAADFAKRRLVLAEENLFSSSESRETLNKGKRWKSSHNTLKGAWPIIYVCLGTASWLIWRSGGLFAQRGALGRYVCLLGANLLCWPPIFFRGHSFRFACLDSTVLVLSTLLTIPKFYEVHRAAGLLLLPYLGWMCFATSLINCSLLSSNPKVAAKAEALTALRPANGPSQQAPGTAPARVERGAGLRQQPSAGCGLERGPPHKSILRVDVQGSTTSEAATSPFSDASIPKSPLAQAKDLLSKMTETLSSNEIPDAPSNEYLRVGILRVNSLLGKVSYSFQGAAEALSERNRSGSGPLAKMGSLLTRVSLSLQRGPSQEVESARWPCSDSIPETFFSCPGAAGYKVRGPAYFSDKKKIAPEHCQGKLVSLNLVSLKDPTFHIARFLPSIRDSKAPFIFVWQVMVPGKTHISLTVAWALQYDPVEAVSAAANRIPEDETVDVHMGDPVVAQESTSGMSTPQRPSPGPQDLGTPLKMRIPEGELAVEQSSKSTSFLEGKRLRGASGQGHRRAASTVTSADAPERPSHSPAGSSSSLRDQMLPASSLPAPEGARPFDISMVRFLDEEGSERDVISRRHSMFKIIPRIEKGGWVVKQAVGQNTPVLLGKKLTTKYFRGPKYLEVDVDVGSSRSAASVVGLVQGALKSLVIDIAVLLEGKSQEELPESLLGTVRLEHLDLSKAATLDTSTGVITRKE